jgi:hypothetical protein
MNEIAKPFDPMQDFQEKLVKRVREDIRELLPDDAINGLIERAVTESFFTETVTQDRWGGKTREPSWFVKEVVKAAEPLLKAAVERYVAAHPAEIEKVIENFLEKNSLTVLTAKMLSDRFFDAVSTATSNMLNSR